MRQPWIFLFGCDVYARRDGFNDDLCRGCSNLVLSL